LAKVGKDGHRTHAVIEPKKQFNLCTTSGSSENGDNTMEKILATTVEGEAAAASTGGGV